MNGKPVIVVSAIRFFQGGTIVIVDECLQYLVATYGKNYTIKALVYNKSIYQQNEGVDWIEFHKARNSSLRRLYYEYYWFKKLSLKWKPILWLSLQDSTPRVKAKTRAVYFHNPLLLKPAHLNLWKAQPRLAVLRLLYKYVYTRGIENNQYIFTQQEHIAEFLAANYCSDKSKIRVFPPILDLNIYKVALEGHPENSGPAGLKSVFTFIFPATAFFYKNYALILTACKLLQKRDLSFRIWLTVDGSENHYIEGLVKEIEQFYPEIICIGFQNRADLFGYYQKADCMIFPSLLESWGLPLSEFSQLNKPVLCADLPYGRESLAHYDKVCYFDPYDAAALAELMHGAINGSLIFPGHSFERKWPLIASWDACFELLLK